MTEKDWSAIKYLLLGVCGAMAVFGVMSSILPKADPNAELVRTVRKSIEIAEGARRDADSARKTSSAFRIVALAIGVIGPLVLAYLIYRLQFRKEPGIEEVLDLMEREKLIDAPQGQPKRLPRKARLRLKDRSSDKDDDNGAKS